MLFWVSLNLQSSDGRFGRFRLGETAVLAKTSQAGQRPVEYAWEFVQQLRFELTVHRVLWHLGPKHDQHEPARHTVRRVSEAHQMIRGHDLTACRAQLDRVLVL